MSERSIAVLTIITALGSAVSGGVLFAFSTFVMAALARLPAQQGIAAMQAINVTVINVPFMATFFGTGVVCLILGVTAVVQRGWAAGWIVAASLLYVLGCLGVTLAFNVPLNEALAKIDAGSPEAESFWSTYQGVWTLWNHVRAAAAIAASLMLTWRFGWYLCRFFRQTFRTSFRRRRPLHRRLASDTNRREASSEPCAG